MKVFISQAMNVLEDEQILSIRKEAIEMIKSEYGEVEIIDSFFDTDTVPADAKPLVYLAKSLELLATADLCVFVDDWQNARGCRLEHECCKQYGIDTKYIEVI